DYYCAIWHSSTSGFF
nr:immunoglobulin light chain junction region [Macaca mulatta]MOW18384.1 immunoglobulin light chain junction region [Macaca mulatta]MOY16409.1 immunoglobulin light chain junction region [Macaca mulatta]